MILPLPFSTIVMGWGRPTFVPEGLGSEDYERLRQDIEDEMNRVQKQVEDTAEQLRLSRKTPVAIVKSQASPDRP